MTTRAVFFDLGGTLLVMRRDTIFQKVIREEGRDASEGEIHRAYMGLESWWLSAYSSSSMTPEQTVEAYRHLDQRVFSSLFSDAEEAEALRVSRLVRIRWPELEKTIPLKLYPDVRPALAKLRRRGYALGLISNAPADTVRVIRPLGLDGYMSTINFSGAVGYTKPNPRIFEIAMEKIGCGPEECVHVGDVYEADVVGAKNAGMKGILIDRLDAQPGLDCPRITSLDQIYGHL